MSILLPYVPLGQASPSTQGNLNFFYVYYMDEVIRPSIGGAATYKKFIQTGNGIINAVNIIISWISSLFVFIDLCVYGG